MAGKRRFIRRLHRLSLRRVLILAGALSLTGCGAAAQTIIDQWNQVQTPAAPLLQPVTIDPAHTALLVLDMAGAQNPARGPCNEDRPRCIATIPALAQLIASARADGVLVIYSVSDAGTRDDIALPLQPRGSEAVVKSGPDKFVGTRLAALLAQGGIRTLIITGTGSEGAVLDTATDAILQKHMSVIVPVDGMSSATLYAEQYVAWHLTHAPGIAQHVTLTRSGLIGF